jgi:hypothetical protein
MNAETRGRGGRWSDSDVDGWFTWHGRFVRYGVEGVSHDLHRRSEGGSECSSLPLRTAQLNWDNGYAATAAHIVLAYSSQYALNNAQLLARVRKNTDGYDLWKLSTIRNLIN